MGGIKDEDLTDDEYEDYDAIQKLHEVAEEKGKRPKKGPGGSENFPNVLPSNVPKSKRKKALENAMYWYDYPKVKNDQEVAERLEAFFLRCIENGEHPTWEKLCLSLGYPRQTVHRWVTGEINASEFKRDLIKKAKEIMASYDAEMAMDGEINPIIYIFRAKNYFGMVDRVEHVANTENVLGELKDQKEIAGRIMGNVPINAVEVEYSDEE